MHANAWHFAGTPLEGTGTATEDGTPDVVAHEDTEEAVFQLRLSTQSLPVG
jgi:hypothetical protein